MAEETSSEGVVRHEFIMEVERRVFRYHAEWLRLEMMSRVSSKGGSSSK